MSLNAHNHWRPGPEIRIAATLILLFLIAQLSDQWTFHHFTFPGIYGRGWGRMLRLAGYFPLWSIVALALVLHDWMPRTLPSLRRATRRGLLCFGPPPASKHAVEGLTKSAALEVARTGVRVNVVAPGTTDTGMLTRFTNSDENKAALVSTVPVKRLATPDEIAHVIAFVASANASYMTGASIPVDGGMLAA
jgi:hypothetical protein